MFLYRKNILLFFWNINTTKLQILKILISFFGRDESEKMNSATELFINKQTEWKVVSSNESFGLSHL